MLHITIPSTELYDQERNEFVYIKEQTLQLEHSLLSVSKWESKWHKSFLKTEKKTKEEMVDYIRCMTITKNVDPNVYKTLSNKIINEVVAYIDDPMTATTFKKSETNRPSREIVTSELIYYWMINFGIPFECQKWNLNRLFTLIKICNIKNGSPKKMSQKEILAQNHALNEARRKQSHSTG